MTREEEIRAAERDVIEAAMRQLRCGYGRGWAAATRELESACERLRKLREPRDPIAEVRGLVERRCFHGGGVSWLDALGVKELLALLSDLERERKDHAQ